jgi:hypothetical protein
MAWKRLKVQDPLELYTLIYDFMGDFMAGSGASLHFFIFRSCEAPHAW